MSMEEINVNGRMSINECQWKNLNVNGRMKKKFMATSVTFSTPGFFKCDLIPGLVLSRFDRFLLTGSGATQTYQHKFAFCIEDDCEHFRRGSVFFKWF